MSEHISRAHVEQFAAEMYAAELARKGSLPWTPYDEAAIAELLEQMRVEAEKPRVPWWRLILRGPR